MRDRSERKFRLGHMLVVFGLFLSLFTLLLTSVNAPKTIAFGTGEIITQSNQYRASAGLPALVTNPTLTSSAQAKADHMAANSYFAHDAPDGTTPWVFFDNSGYQYSTAGENLALTNQSASSVVTGWYNSPGHRANMLSAEFSEVGYGIAFVPTFTYEGVTYNNVYLVAAHYAKPVQAIAVAQTTAPIAPPTIPQPTAPQTQQITPTEETPPTETPEPVSEPVGTQNATEQRSTPGTVTVASTDQPQLSARLGYVGLIIGLILICVGSIVEIIRYFKHLPLLPHRG